MARKSSRSKAGAQVAMPTTVERWPLSRLRPYERNARTHSDEQVDQIVQSMREFGWTVPILVTEDGTVVAGHGRLEAAKRLGMTEAPVLVARGWTERQRRKYTIVDNRLAENSNWDRKLLGAEIAALLDEQDNSIIGFNKAQLTVLLNDDAKDTGPQLGALQFSIVVKCRDEVQQAELIARFESEGLQCSAMMS